MRWGRSPSRPTLGRSGKQGQTGRPSKWPEIQVRFIPKCACWLNLIEPWWKQLRSLALKGKRFETLGELTEALEAALDYWNVPIGILTAGRNGHKSSWSYWVALALSKTIRKLNERTA